MLVQNGDDVSEDAAVSEFAVLALDARPRRVNALRERFLDRGMYGRVSATLFDGMTIPCIDELANVVMVEAAHLAGTEIVRSVVPGVTSTLLRTSDVGAGKC